jgi:O-antigen ligase
MTILIATVLILTLLAVLTFSPWMTIAILLLVPVVKGGAEYYVPFFQKSMDLTFVTCLLAGVMALWNLIRRPHIGAPLSIPWKLLACMVVLALALTIGLAWTTAHDYGFRKAGRFAGIGIPFLLLPAFLIRSRHEARRAIHAVIATGALVAFAILVLPQSYFALQVYGRGYARGTVWGSSPIIPSVLSAVAVLCLLTGFLVKGGASRWLRYSAFLVLPLGLYAIISTGTRSSFFGLLIASALLPLFVGRGGRVKGVFVLFIAIPVAAAVGFMLIESATGPKLTRWEKLAGPDRIETLVESRTYHYLFCIQNWWKRPILGHGSGSFAVDAFNRDEPAWPHNIILEALYETGLVGTAALVAFLWIAVRTGRRGLKFAVDPGDRFLVLAPAVMFVVLLIQGLTHWDIDGVRFLYLFTGLLYANVNQVARDPSRKRIGSLVLTGWAQATPAGPK